MRIRQAVRGKLRKCISVLSAILEKCGGPGSGVPGPCEGPQSKPVPKPKKPPAAKPPVKPEPKPQSDGDRALEALLKPKPEQKPTEKPKEKPKPVAKKPPKEKPVTAKPESKPEPEKPKPAAAKPAIDNSDFAHTYLSMTRSMTKPPAIQIQDAREAIKAYSGDGMYDKMNAELRQGVDPKDIKPKPQGGHLQEMASQKLDMPVVTYRGVGGGAYAEKLRNLKPGDVVENRGLVSTSVQPEVASSFSGNDGSVVLKIKAKSGLYLGDDSEFPEERELVQAHGVKYRYSHTEHDVQVGEWKRTVVHMEEVD